MAKRVIVVTPSTLTQNWAAEVQKWLGAERCKALVMQPGAGAESQVHHFPCSIAATDAVANQAKSCQMTLHIVEWWCIIMFGIASCSCFLSYTIEVDTSLPAHVTILD